MTSYGTIGTRLHRHLFETERRYPHATGELSALLSQLALAGTRIARVLSRAGLLSSERRSRSIIYRADLDRLQGLVLFLLKDCCQGRAELCEPLLAELNPCRT